MAERVPEPWMFGVDVTVDGVKVGPPRIVRFTLMSRVRMALRRLQGKPALRMMPLTEGETDA